MSEIIEAVSEIEIHADNNTVVSLASMSFEGHESYHLVLNVTTEDSDMTMPVATFGENVPLSVAVATLVAIGSYYNTATCSERVVEMLDGPEWSQNIQENK